MDTSDWSGACPSRLFGVELHQPVQEIAPLQQRLDADVFIEAMDIAQIRPEEDAADAVGGYAGRVEELAVGGAGLQQRQHRHAGPELRRQLLHRPEDGLVKGGGGELPPRISSVSTLTAGSAMARSSARRTVSCVTPGKMRQLMLARARCGRALVAWPASSMVATQVVRSIAAQPASRLDTSATAAASCGLATMARIAAATSAWPCAAWMSAMPFR